MKKYSIILASACLCIQGSLNAIFGKGTRTKTHSSQEEVKVSAEIEVDQQYPLPSQQDLQQYFNGVNHNRKKLIKLAQQYGPNIINRRDQNCPLKRPLLLSAAFSWPIEDFSQLLSTPGIDINIIDSHGFSAFDIASTPTTSAYKDPSPFTLKKLQLLIKHGIKINRANPSGYTPLIRAAKYNQPKVVTLLLNAGASTQGKVTQGEFSGKTFFDFAAQNPAVKDAYEHYLKTINNLGIHLQDIKPISNLINEYSFDPMDTDSNQLPKKQPAFMYKIVKETMIGPKKTMEYDKEPIWEDINPTTEELNLKKKPYIEKVLN